MKDRPQNKNLKTISEKDRWKKGKQKIERFEDLEKIGDREAIYAAALKGAKKGNHALIRELLDRYFGKVVQPMEVKMNEQAIIETEERKPIWDLDADIQTNDSTKED